MASNRSTSKGRSPAAYVSSVAVMVSNREVALDWYTRRLGLDVVEIDPIDPHWVTVGRQGRGGAIHLCQAGDYPDLTLEPGNSGIDLRVDTDFRHACSAWRRRGVKFTIPPTKRTWGWEAQIKDPDGNVIRITPPLGR